LPKAAEWGKLWPIGHGFYRPGLTETTTTGAIVAENTFDIGQFCGDMEGELGCQDGPSCLFWRAFSFAVDAHQNQRRKSGEAYVSHPCEVTRILVEEFGVRDPETLAAAVLHDTVEDVEEVTLEVIGEMFGKGVEDIVDGLTKMADSDGDHQAFVKQVHRKIST